MTKTTNVKQKSFPRYCSSLHFSHKWKVSHQSQAEERDMLCVHFL